MTTAIAVLLAVGCAFTYVFVAGLLLQVWKDDDASREVIAVFWLPALPVYLLSLVLQLVAVHAPAALLAAIKKRRRLRRQACRIPRAEVRR